MQVGLGWYLIAEASVTRILKGFPDDLQFLGHSSYSTIKGWLRTSTIPGLVESFSIANDGSTSTCTDEVSDYNYMNSNFSDYYDTEPDIFAASAPGLNIQFLFDKDGNIKKLSSTDAKITYATDGAGLINSFTITNDRGIKYVFDKKASCVQTVDIGITPSSLNAFRRDYVFYRHNSGGDVATYTAKWYINYIEDTKGNQIIYTYDGTEVGTPLPKSEEKAQIVKYVSGAYTKQVLYTTTKYMYEQRIKYIKSQVSDVIATEAEFNWEGSVTESKLASIKFNRSGSFASFTYSAKFNKNNNQSNWGRVFLTNLSISRTGSNFFGEYKFKYFGIDFDNPNDSYLYNPQDSNVVKSQDYWGYYNAVANTELTPSIWVYPDNSSVTKFKITEIPSYGGNVVALSGADRSATTSAMYGTMTQITYPTGGVTVLEYENKDYLDKDINAAVLGGGIRIKKITHNDGLNTNDVTSYSYNDPSTSVTTGRAISEPQFTFAIPNSSSYGTLSDRVKYSTYRTVSNFSQESSEILYGKVTVSKTNGGKTIYEFNTSAIWGGSTVNEWSENTSYISRYYTSNPSTCNAIAPDFLTNGKYSYPFPPNPNFDFERGLPTKVTSKSESGNTVSEETYTYQRSHTSPIVIQALRFDDIIDVRAYAKYNILAVVDNLIASRTTKIYSTQSPYTAYTTETETYTYPTSGEHRLPKKIEKTNSDGNIYTSYFRYVKDPADGSDVVYTNTSSGGDDYDKSIYYLKDKNVNARIESYHSATVGSTEKFIGGELTAFKPFYNNETAQYMYLPSESWKFVSVEGTTSFSPSIVSSGTLTKDAKYIKTGTILEYDYGGNAVSVIGNSRVANTVLYEPINDLKVAEFSNAKIDEIMYNCFDFGSPYGYFTSVSNTTWTEPGRASYKCFTLTSSSSLSKSVTMAATNTDMIFSCWAKDATSTVTLTVNLSASGLNSNYTISIPAGTTWTYYEKRIPRPSNSSVTVTVTLDGTIKIDDILFYPGNASVKTYSYDIKTYSSGYTSKILTAETGMGGTARYFEYDPYGRPYLVKDVENNIVEMKVYRQVHNWQDLTTPTVAWSTPVYKDVSTTFTPTSSIPYGTQGVLYTWTWGDGSTETSTSSTKAHTYTTTGNFTMTCKIEAPGFTSLTSSNYTVSVSNQPPPPVYPTICAAGIAELTSSNECIQYSCSGLSANCSQTKFKLVSIDGESLNDVEAWIWDKAPIGTESWTTVGYTDQLTISFNQSTTESYKVRIRIAMVSGAWGTSNSLTVLNNLASKPQPKP